MPDESQLTDRETVAEQYATTTNLETRRGVWGPGSDGVSPVDMLRESVIACQPGRVLEIGCGMGQLARSVIDALPGVDYLATDASEAMVEATRSLGVPAQTVRAEALPLRDDSFDVVVAAWMLYHVTDLDGVLREVRRVLRPGGTFLAATNGDEHLAGIMREAGGSPILTQFSSENGSAALLRHFDEVSQRDVTTWATFPDHDAAVAYLASFDPTLARSLPPFTGERRYAGFGTVFTAR